MRDAGQVLGLEAGGRVGGPLAVPAPGEGRLQRGGLDENAWLGGDGTVIFDKTMGVLPRVELPRAKPG